jgi:hypothetical protein
MFRFKQRRLADLGTPHMEVIAGISQGFAALTDIMIVGALSVALHPSRNPNMRSCVFLLLYILILEISLSLPT